MGRISAIHCLSEQALSRGLCLRPLVQGNLFRPILLLLSGWETFSAPLVGPSAALQCAWASLFIPPDWYQSRQRAQIYCYHRNKIPQRNKKELLALNSAQLITAKDTET